jgi:cold shock protein
MSFDNQLTAFLRSQTPSPSSTPRRDWRNSKEPSMFFGRVKMFSERGFGFITRDDGGSDVFVHISAVTESGIRALQEGDRVEFNIVAGRSGKTEAADLRLLEAA